jgi:hypothetical protein
MYCIIKKHCGKSMPDTQFKFFTHYHHLKVSQLDHSVVNLLRINGKTRYQTEGGWWSSKNERVLKDNGASEKYVGLKFIDKLKCQAAALCAKGAELMIVQTANIDAVEGIERCQRVK